MILGKVDFKAKHIHRSEEGNFVMKNESICKEIYIITVSKCKKQKSAESKGEKISLLLLFLRLDTD